MADARDICCYFDPVRQTHSGNFAESRVRLLRRLRINAGTYTALLRASLQRRARRLIARPLAAGTYQLIECRHRSPCPLVQALCYRARDSAASAFPHAGVWMAQPTMLLPQKLGRELIRTFAHDGGTTPLREVLRFVSSALHSLPTGGRTRKDVSRGYLRRNPKKYLLTAQLLHGGRHTQKEQPKPPQTGKPE